MVGLLCGLSIAPPQGGGGGGSPTLAVVAGICPTVTLPAAGVVVVGVHQVVMLAVLIEAVGLGVGVAVSEGSGCHGQVVWLMCKVYRVGVLSGSRFRTLRTSSQQGGRRVLW